MLCTILPTIAICCYVFRQQIRKPLSEILRDASRMLGETDGNQASIDKENDEKAQIKTQYPFSGNGFGMFNREKTQIEKEQIEEEAEAEAEARAKFENDKERKKDKKKAAEENLKKIDKEKRRLLQH